MGNFGTAVPTGIQATATIGSATITSQINSGWGRAEWGNEGWGVNETEVNKRNWSSDDYVKVIKQQLLK